MKRYVKVEAVFDEDGKMTPKALFWEDIRYPISRVLDVRKGASLKAGCAGMVYTCVINGKQKRLFYEVDKWILE